MMYGGGILVGIVTFLLIGAFHGVVVKTEYHFGKEVWPVFLIAGAVFLLLALFTEAVTVSSILAVFGITCLWSIKELFEQEERVKKGWFPENPAKKGRRRKK